ncbi:hypothetical protein IFM89_025640 [Coptis chinensis]|uniref:Uncharacterized protein n=1 Tax=Coptis chinensis TaxID=261450 RepID=A0A835H5F7_9MAGN|nr:hypothetical protein IFM89_025640 [Coptis chinensis]
MKNFVKILHLSSFLVFLPLLVSCDEVRELYIVYLGDHDGSKTHQEIEDTHHRHLLSVKKNEQEGGSHILYSYKNSVNGFAAVLTAGEAKLLSDKDEVVLVAQDRPNIWSLKTTRSWEFMGLEGGREFGGSTASDMRGNLRQKANYGKDIVIGLLDTGIWPESRSFNDEGLGPVPKSWKGICQAGDSFNSSHCNRKLIGARYYLKAHEFFHGQLNKSFDYRSPRDFNGHGTHTSSTAGGRKVENVSALGGFASGTASGGAPLARLAMYKVCWPIIDHINKNVVTGNDCVQADMLAAMDDAIGDGVDVISISIGANAPSNHTSDAIAIGSLHAIKKNIVVSCSAGNSGPAAGTVENVAPWVISVGASTIDRTISSPLVLGNGVKIEGHSATPYKLKKKMYPLVYAGDVVEPHVPKNSSAGQCLPGSLSPKKTKSKIVLCIRGEGAKLKKSEEVKRAGGVGMILGNNAEFGEEINLDAHFLPATEVGAKDATTIFNYIKSSNNSIAQFDPSVTVLGIKPAPSMAVFSSTGPNSLVEDILKPDITAPGQDILAAWNEKTSPTGLPYDHRYVKYIMISGTSMACPHVAGLAALVKAVHPTWSSAAIRSALMTTATLTNNLGKPIITASREVANPFNFGSGHVRPTKTADPGLVYDATFTDYILYLCSIGDQKAVPSFHCPKVPPSVHDLNHPSLAISHLNGTMIVKRTVTNVGGRKSVYRASVTAPRGISVKLSPNILYFNRVGEKQSFTITIKAKRSLRARNSTTGGYSFGSYTWKDGIHVVRSPIAVSQSGYKREKLGNTTVKNVGW